MHNKVDIFYFDLHDVLHYQQMILESCFIIYWMLLIEVEKNSMKENRQSHVKSYHYPLLGDHNDYFTWMINEFMR